MKVIIVVLAILNLFAPLGCCPDPEQHEKQIAYRVALYKAGSDWKNIAYMLYFVDIGDASTIEISNGKLIPYKEGHVSSGLSFFYF